MRVLLGLGSVGAIVLHKRNNPEPWACYMDSAEQYMGTTAVANSGQQCMQWSDAAKHADYGGQHFLGLTKGESSGPKLEGDFCRAFAGDAKPWCFVKGAIDVATARQDCDVNQCPTDGPWGRQFDDEAKDTIKCTDQSGEPAAECDCSCVGVGGKAFIQEIRRKDGSSAYCHC